jgi:hypothetical protein
MKNLFIVVILILRIGLINAQTNVSIEANGNLEAPSPCGCIDLLDVKAENNPADILVGMGKCIELKEFEKAVRLFAISGVYGKFDTYRVKDKSAHQALLVLQQNILMNIEEKDQKDFIRSLEKELKKNSKELNNICESINKVGIPKYYPRYMIQHGIQAFMENAENGLVEDFNSMKSWDLALKTYLHCGE